MERDLVWETMRSEVERLGGSIDEVRSAKGGHRMVYWTTVQGRRQATTVPAYTGNWRQVKNTLAQVRRASRQ